MMSETDKAGEGFSAEERAAMKARAKELKADARGDKGAKKAAADESSVLTKIAEMAPEDGALAARIHDIVKDAAPELAPKLWYGQPAYAKDGTVVCFFRSGQGDKERYSTFGFSTAANLDDGGLWPTSFAVTTLSTSDEKTIRELVTRAVG